MLLSICLSVASLNNIEEDCGCSKSLFCKIPSGEKTASTSKKSPISG